jgi:predicted nucleic acid-binding Zn ribbon protein
MARCAVSDRSEEDQAGVATGTTPLSTGTGGQLDETVDNRPDQVETDPARAALHDAQRLARGGLGRRGRRGSAAGKRIRRQNLSNRGSGGYSGPAPDATDPQLLGRLLPGYIVDRGWQRPLAEARVFADWATIVGDDVAAHCAPVSLRDGELRVSAESTAWATQLRLLAPAVLARLVAELGAGVVRKLMISGPAAPSWKHGVFSVRGARGPRDTYG